VQVDHLLNIARRKTNRPTAVTASWEALGEPGHHDGVRMEIADDNVTWGNRETVLVDRREEDAEPARYEAETGKCGLCGGDGQEWRGWNRETGSRWRECKRCNGMGICAASPLPGGRDGGRG
jgi:hypothetical protein